MADRSPSMLMPALIGGTAFGVVGGIPVLNYLNCLCCSLVAAGGFLAAYLYSRKCAEAGVPFRAAQGATVGLIAGLFYAIATTVVQGVLLLVVGGGLEEAFAEVERRGDIPPEAQQIFEFFSNASPFLLIVLVFCLSLLCAAIFSTIGGLIGASVFKVNLLPPAPPTGGTMPPLEPPVGRTPPSSEPPPAGGGPFGGPPAS